VRVQMLAREVNQRMRELLWVADDVACDFGCECVRPSCTAAVVMSTARYDAVRAHGARFIVRRGHEEADDDVVDSGRGWVVVEKRGAERALVLWGHA
jgi:hypothetical protein